MRGHPSGLAAAHLAVGFVDANTFRAQSLHSFTERRSESRSDRVSISAGEGVHGFIGRETFLLDAEDFSDRIAEPLSIRRIKTRDAFITLIGPHS
jgi:hypothetical protein